MSKTDPHTVKLMTTQVTLSDDVVKVSLNSPHLNFNLFIQHMQSLTKIGIRITTRPAECTHLLVPQLVRTEKFLCAMAVAPFILQEEWALESAAAKHLLRTFIPRFIWQHETVNMLVATAEEKYLLQDSKNEKKYAFKLSDALRRAKAVGGRLFDKTTFYVTPKVPVDVKLLKNVVNAGGGQVSVLFPCSVVLGLYPPPFLGLDYHTHRTHTQSKREPSCRVVSSRCLNMEASC
jgi:hypothetical protein